ncbi:hypothetical protein AURDEDRAFT_109561 [Auricularia subglabra TFB-10046 SS5]|nr:hypothetical protein AURDEDRAFT_109561 [Auricularia subglabra TFB-10046 SS5]
MYTPRPFKNPNYTKNVNRRMKNFKSVLAAERERERVLREQQRQQIADGIENVEEVAPTYLSIEAPPSVLPQPHYCDITGLEGPYTDPATGLRYHDKSVYEFIRGMNPGTEKFYLAARGVHSIVK